MRAGNIVLDTSAILALMLDEPGAEIVRPVADQAMVSAVNLSELVAKLQDMRFSEEDQRLAVEIFSKIAIGFDTQQAILAGQFRANSRHLGLSLGDRSCLALAQQRGGQVLTADRAWAELDVGVEIEVIR